MGGLSEKLLTLEEAARRLERSRQEVEEMIRGGRLPAFRLEGSHLRVRLKDLEAFREARAARGGQRDSSQEELQVVVPAFPLRPSQIPLPVVSHPSGSRGRNEPTAWSSAWDGVVDFLYFNDFYLVGILVFLTLLAIIFLL